MLHIDLDTKTVRQGRKNLIVNGVPQNGFVISNEKITFQKIEQLYAVYKHSIPHSNSKHHTYFKALNEDELSQKDLITGTNRQKAQTELEMAIITGSLNGSLQWPDETKWFWQSEQDRDLVLLRKWIV